MPSPSSILPVTPCGRGGPGARPRPVPFFSCGRSKGAEAGVLGSHLSQKSDHSRPRSSQQQFCSLHLGLLFLNFPRPRQLATEFSFAQFLKSHTNFQQTLPADFAPPSLELNQHFTSQLQQKFHQLIVSSNETTQQVQDIPLGKETL